MIWGSQCFLLSCVILVAYTTRRNPQITSEGLRNTPFYVFWLGSSTFYSMISLISSTKILDILIVKKNVLILSSQIFTRSWCCKLRAVAGHWKGTSQFFSELSGDRKAVRKIASRWDTLYIYMIYDHIWSMTDGGGARVRMEPDWNPAFGRDNDSECRSGLDIALSDRAYSISSALRVWSRPWIILILWWPTTPSISFGNCT